MDLSVIRPSPYPFFISPQNYVHWVETPQSHLFSVDLPGVRKEEIRVELEDSHYLIIRTERDEESTEAMRKFMRKFRLPERVNLDGISATYENGVLTVTVPRSFVRWNLRINSSDLIHSNGNLSARAA
ncbi:15.4 kDa class V heat shock protein-like [Tasmannia lanceolata]|uniref:15.4 kDa class V heat shock protein-like n=1 Tax=Tasmannia lanceolata TaxID=3420 RepID=UPI0040645A12